VSHQAGQSFTRPILAYHLVRMRELAIQKGVLHYA
jgi:hypothetical protein